MKRILFVLSIALAIAQVGAQTNPVARLAIVPESGDANPVADVLTVELSKRGDVQLVERAEIEKVYREQVFSAGNTDYLKLGRVLGADGLLLLNRVKDGTNEVLNMRLVAVKPGVVLAIEKFTWTEKDVVEWSQSVVGHLKAFISKLAVLAKDAVPISVVNLRSALSTADASETERQLKLLTIQRLSREPRLFVLERQQMQLLSEEKELNADESAFWNGSYLLEGVVDQNGYSKDTMTINARLTARGKPPLSFGVSGPRTNLAAVVNSLTIKLVALLQVGATTNEWNAAEEAAQYFEEAAWALRWGVLSEAQAAVESAWALGKRDLDCGLLRIHIYESIAQRECIELHEANHSFGPGYDLDGNPQGPAPSNARVEEEINWIRNQHPLIAGMKISARKRSIYIAYAYADHTPSGESIEAATRAIELYRELSHHSPKTEAEVLWKGAGWNDWHNSDWYNQGLNVLETSSRVLRVYCLVPSTDKTMDEKLANLRALTRSVANDIANARSVLDSYFVGQRLATYDELANTIGEKPNIFATMASWGCFWQERPDDALELYRWLMKSPVFCYLHEKFWKREVAQPRLAAWNEEDWKRLPSMWIRFTGELEQSTNLLCRMEAAALQVSDAKSEESAQAAKEQWWSLVRSNRSELISNHVELFYLGWGFGSDAETEAMDKEYRQKTIPQEKATAAFEEQKNYLRENRPYNFKEFIKVFAEKSYTTAQAREILPLVKSYMSNLLSQSETANGAEKFRFKANAQSVDVFLERDVERLANPNPLSAMPPQTPQPPRVQPVPAAPAPATVLAGAPASITNVIEVKKFLEIPLTAPEGEIQSAYIQAHQWLAGKLVLNLRCNAGTSSFDDTGKLFWSRLFSFPAIAILNPETEQWTVVNCQGTDYTTENRFYHRTTLWHGDIFNSDGGHVRRYDARNKSWQDLSLPDVGNCELFTVGDHLYAATTSFILELLGGGAETRVIASNRRQPPTSSLDREIVSAPVLFAGPGSSVRIATANKIFFWNGSDWGELCQLPWASLRPTISDDGVLFVGDGWNSMAGIAQYSRSTDQVVCCLQQPRTYDRVDKAALPIWKRPEELPLGAAPVAAKAADVFVLSDHANKQQSADAHFVTGIKILPQDGYHAALYCFEPHLQKPLKLYLKFADISGVAPPVFGEKQTPGLPHSAGWMCFGDRLFLGREFPDSFGDNNTTFFPKAGVWMCSTQEIDAGISCQKKAQLEESAADEKRRKELVEATFQQYDHNHNGRIDLEEREAVLDFPVFLNMELDSIDSNHNGLLDASELSYFDPNHNQILDEKEKSGIDLTQQFLAKKLLGRFDQSGSGWLSDTEFSAMVHATVGTESDGPISWRFQSADRNHDGHVDAEELKDFLMRYTRIDLFRTLRSRPPGGKKTGAGGVPFSVEPREAFKKAVEEYWRIPEGLPKETTR